MRITFAAWLMSTPTASANRLMEGYRQLQRAERGVVLAYLQRLSGYSRAQLTRLVSSWSAGLPLVKNYRRPQHDFARRYTGADVVLLAEVDRAMGTRPANRSSRCRCWGRCAPDVLRQPMPGRRPKP